MCLWRFDHKDRTKQVLMTTEAHCEPITQTICWGSWGHIWPHTLIHPEVAQAGKYIIIIIWTWCFGVFLSVKAKMNRCLQISTVGIDHVCFSSWNIIVSLASLCVGVGDMAKITSVHYYYHTPNRTKCSLAYRWLINNIKGLPLKFSPVEDMGILYPCFYTQVQQ